MSVTILGNPATLWDYETGAPFSRNKSTLISFTEAMNECMFTPGYVPPTQNAITPRQNMTQDVGGSGVTKDRVYHRGALAMRSGTTIVPPWVGLGGLQFIPETDRAGLADGYDNPSWKRVQWFTMRLAVTASAAWGLESGLVFAGNGTDVAGFTRFWPVFPGTTWTVGFGITGDGAGNWQFVNFSSGFPGTPPLEVVSLASAIADPEDYNRFDFVFVSATGTRAANFQLLINDALFLERQWEGTGILLEHLPVTNYRWVPIWLASNTTPGIFHFMTNWNYRMGRFLPDGRELTT